MFVSAKSINKLKCGQKIVGSKIQNKKKLPMLLIWEKEFIFIFIFFVQNDSCGDLKLSGFSTRIHYYCSQSILYRTNIKSHSAENCKMENAQRRQCFQLNARRNCFLFLMLKNQQVGLQICFSMFSLFFFITSCQVFCFLLLFISRCFRYSPSIVSSNLPIKC